MDNESTLRIFSGTLHVLRDIHFLCDVVFINLLRCLAMTSTLKSSSIPTKIIPKNIQVRRSVQ